MKVTKTNELVREGRYVAEVEVESIETDSDWSPYVSLQDALKLENVRLALRQGDLETAAKFGAIYELTPIAAELNHDL